MGWAAVHGERILAWDGWYEENRKLRTLGDLNQMYSDVEKIATEQLGSALWCAELAGETNSILSTVRYQMMLNDNRGPDNEEVFELRRAGVVSYMILGPASDLLPYLQKQPV